MEVMAGLGYVNTQNWSVSCINDREAKKELITAHECQGRGVRMPWLHCPRFVMRLRGKCHTGGPFVLILGSGEEPVFSVNERGGLRKRKRLDVLCGDSTCGTMKTPARNNLRAGRPYTVYPDGLRRSESRGLQYKSCAFTIQRGTAKTLSPQHSQRDD